LNKADKEREIEVYLNMLAQGLVDREEGIYWFEKKTVDEKSDILDTLYLIATQSSPGFMHVDDAIERSGLKKTYTPCVLLKKCDGVKIPRVDIQLTKIICLPHEEYNKAFRLMLSLFTVCDELRRKDRCRGKCSHWWHQDLSNIAKDYGFKFD